MRICSQKYMLRELKEQYLDWKVKQYPSADSGLSLEVIFEMMKEKKILTFEEWLEKEDLIEDE